MRRWCTLLMVLVVLVSRLDAEDLGNQPAAVQPSLETIVYPLRSGSAQELAVTLQDIYELGGIVALPQQNVLLLRVDESVREEMLRTLAELDRAPRTIVVHAYLLRSHGDPMSAAEAAEFSGRRSDVLQRIDVLRKSDRLSIENRIELATVENEKALAQTGKEVSLVAGTTVSPSRGRTNSYQRAETGTIFTVVARVTPENNMLLQLNFEKSDIQHSLATGDDPSPSPPALIRLTHQSTVRLASGDAVLAGTMVGKADDPSGHYYLVVTAHEAEGVGRPAASAGGPQAGARVGSRRPRSDPPAPARAAARDDPRLEAMAKAAFERADRDGNQRLSGDELSSGVIRSFRLDFGEDQEVTFDAFHKSIAARVERRNSAESAQPATRSDRSDSRSLDERYRLFARRVVERFDTDQDGRLNVDERSRMNLDLSAVDADQDGFVTPEELGTWYRDK